MSKPTSGVGTKSVLSHKNAPTFIMFPKPKLDWMLLCWESWLWVLNQSCCYCCFGKLDKEVDEQFIHHSPQVVRPCLFSGISGEKCDLYIKHLQWAMGMW